jgi:hypothetical protein
MDNDEFGIFSLQDEGMRASSGSYDTGHRTDPISNAGGYQASDPSGEIGGIRYDYDPNRKVRIEMEELERDRARMTAQYSRPPKAKGAALAKVAGSLGIASLIIGLVFLAGWGVDYTIIRIGFILLLGCLMLPLGALLSIAAFICGIISLILGAGGSRSKAIFAIIFSVVFWLMVAAWYFVANYYFSG